VSEGQTPGKMLKSFVLSEHLEIACGEMAIILDDFLGKGYYSTVGMDNTCSILM